MTQAADEARKTAMLDFQKTEPTLLAAVLRLCRRLHAAGGRPLLVGGAVRDALLRRPVTDFDVEVYGLDAAVVRETVEAEHPVVDVGESFGVLKLRGLPVDVSLPRRESRVAPGHRGFDVRADPALSIEEATSRRDFTVNSMLWDPVADELLDPFEGTEDLENRILRHTSEAFDEDPLRVLRGMQLVARYELTVHPGTVARSRRLAPTELARERILEEWKKLLLLGRSLSSGLTFLRDVDWLRHYPELERLVGCEQDPEWHPEGDVWIHLGMVMDAYATARIGEEWEDLVVGFGCLCHDLGKPATTAFVDGRIRARGHEAAGEAPTRSFLARLTDSEALAREVVPLVQHHMKPRQLAKADSGDAAIRRLARKVGRIDRLARVARADAGGRPPKPWEGEESSADWLLARAEALEVSSSAPRPLVLGRHLIERGLVPGPDFGPLLERCFEAQIDGGLTTLSEALAHLDRMLAAESPRGASPGTARRVADETNGDSPVV